MRRSRKKKGKNLRTRVRRRKLSRMHRSTRSGIKKPIAPRTAKQFFSKSQNFQDAWNRAVGVVSKMRAEKLSLPQASREFEIGPRSVIRLVRSAMRKRKNGRYVPRAVDHLLRVLVVPTKDGLREITVRDSREASKLGECWSAVRKYLQTGDDSDLRKFRRTTILDASGKRVHLLTDVHELDRLGSAGVLSFESIYSRVA